MEVLGQLNDFELGQGFFSNQSITFSWGAPLVHKLLLLWGTTSLRRAPSLQGAGPTPLLPILSARWPPSLPPPGLRLGAGGAARHRAMVKRCQRWNHGGPMVAPWRWFFFMEKMRGLGDSETWFLLCSRWVVQGKVYPVVIKHDQPWQWKIPYQWRSE